MTVATLTSREFNQDASGAKKAARRGPVFDTAVAQRCARLHVPDRRAERDALIAATALTHGLTVVTRNVADFGSVGVALLNPWEDQHADEPE